MRSTGYVLLFLVQAVKSNCFQILHLHALTLAARSYALLLIGIAYHNQIMYSTHNATNTWISNDMHIPALWVTQDEVVDKWILNASNCDNVFV